MGMMARHSRRLQRWATISGVALTAACVFFAVTSSAAGALTCSGPNHYYYAGQLYPHYQQGIETHITVEALGAVNYNHEHNIAYADLQSTTSTACNVKGACWLQSGYGKGKLECGTRTTLKYYVEWAAEENTGHTTEAVTCVWNTSWPAPSGNLFSTVFYTGTDHGHAGQIYTYMNYGTGARYLATSWLPYTATVAYPTTTNEVEIITGTRSCPSVPAFEYFGAKNATGTYTTGYAIHLSSNGRTWGLWQLTPSVLTNSPYAWAESHKWDEFVAWS